MNSCRLKKGDMVMLIAGKDKGKTGKVLKIDRTMGRVVVENCNMMKKTQKPRREGEKGSILELEASLHISNVMLNCPKCGPVRSGMKLDGDKKMRICKKCGGSL